MYTNTDNQIVVQRPSVWAIDLKTNNLIGRHEIPLSVVENGKGLSSITIDDDDCSNSFAYIADNFNSILIVFNARENRSWRFNNNWFFFNPFEVDFCSFLSVISNEFITNCVTYSV